MIPGVRPHQRIQISPGGTVLVQYAGKSAMRSNRYNIPEVCSRYRQKAFSGEVGFGTTYLGNYLTLRHSLLSNTHNLYYNFYLLANIAPIVAPETKTEEAIGHQIRPVSLTILPSANSTAINFTSIYAAICRLARLGKFHVFAAGGRRSR